MFRNKKPLVIKKQTVSVPVDKSRKPSTPVAPRSPLPRSSTPISASRSTAKARPASSSSSTPVSAKRKRAARPAHTPLDFGSSDDDGDDDGIATNGSALKRRRSEEPRCEPRDVRSAAAFSEDAKSLKFIHAADIPALDRSVKYESSLPGLSEPHVVKMRYPSRCPRERYQLVTASKDSQGYDPIHDITEAMYKIIENYLPKDQISILGDESSGLPKRLSRAMSKRLVPDIDKVIAEWNDLMQRYLDDGSIVAALDEMGRPSPALVERIVNQTFSRTVSLNLKALHEYEAGGDNVYGELLPKFVSRILVDTQLRSGQVFVDLGSGVGNVVLQAALETGCESWGCEMMEKYCDVAKIQHKEFVRRCQLWGMSTGDIHLVRGDFLANPEIHAALRRADLILVNNQVFSPQLNDGLTTLFLDLKDGCRIVSLKSFVPAGHKINVRNSQSPYSVLGNIMQKEYFSRSVSWTDQGGKYFISTKDQAFLDQYNRNGV